LESYDPINFSASVRCNYIRAGEIIVLNDITGTKEFNIFKEFCGDGFCESYETSDNCNTDCPTLCGDGFCNGGETCQTCSSDCGLCSVSFRTTDKLYLAGSAIALLTTNTCGNTLNKYGIKGTSSYNCLPEHIIVTTKEGYPVCSRPGYDKNIRVYVRKGTEGLIYESSDPDASKVSISPNPSDSNKEVDCVPAEILTQESTLTNSGSYGGVSRLCLDPLYPQCDDLDEVDGTGKVISGESSCDQYGYCNCNIVCEYQIYA